MIDTLQDLGMTPFFEEAARSFVSAFPSDEQADLELGRVVGVERATYQVWTLEGPREARLAGTLRQPGSEQLSQPVIGDWLVVQRAAPDGVLRVVHVLPRRTTFARAVNSGLSEQVIAANVDVVLIVTTPGEEFDVPRLGRYVAAVRTSGARPVIVLNKTDLIDDPTPYLEQVRTLGEDLPIHEVAATRAHGLDTVRPYFRAGVTVALIGSSGVGKSTLTNALLGRDAAVTGSVRSADQQGRHTTTGRTLYAVPGGGLLIDNPGLRDIAVWDATGGSAGFEQIEELAAHCRFRKCTHTTEPGCAVLRAVHQGKLSAESLTAYRETQGLSRRRSKRR